MNRDFRQFDWDAATEEDCRELVRLAVREDLEREQDWTTVSLVPAERNGATEIVARQAGFVAGAKVLQVVIDEMACRLDLKLDVRPHSEADSDHADARQIAVDARHGILRALHEVDTGFNADRARGNDIDVFRDQRPLLRLRYGARREKDEDKGDTAHR